MQLHSETQIRLVGTETVHRLLPGHSLNRKLYVHIQNFFEQIRQQSLVYVNDIIHIHE